MAIYTVGADPEVFLKKQGLLQSAYGKIPGTKEEPFKVPCGAVQVDGMAAEFNIEPTKNAHKFSENIQSVLCSLKELIPEYEISAQPTAWFGKDFIDSQPYEAKMLGCDPDFNAYTGELNPIPDSEAVFRTGAGHIHIGWIPEGDEDINCPIHFRECQAVVKQLDAYLGVASLLFDPDNQRRKLYGSPGAFRPKPYGVEYRVLSNAWVTSPALCKWIFKTTQLAINSLVSGHILNDKGYVVPDLILRGDRYEAMEYLYDNDLPKPPRYEEEG